MSDSLNASESNNKGENMKKIFLIVLGALFSLSAIASPVGIVRIDTPDEQNLNYSIYATDGQVYTVHTDNVNLVDQLRYAMDKELEVKLNVAEDLKVVTDALAIQDEILAVDVTIAETDEKTDLIAPSLNKSNTAMMSTYDPSILQNAPITNFQSRADMMEVFKSQRKKLKRKSQCYNRAHIWSHEMQKKRYMGEKIFPGKIWVFYSKYFIKRIGYKWWFHISPYAKLKGQDMVLDRTFLKEPLSPDDWVQSFFKRRSIKCNEVNRYSDYKNYQRSADCFLIKTSLYYWQPHQIRKAESKGKERTKLTYGSLKKAYRNALSWFARVP